MFYGALSTIAAAALVASPAVADPLDLGGGKTTTGVFAGGSLRVAFGGKGRQAPQAGLQLTTVRAQERPNGALMFSPPASRGLELNLLSRKPSLLIAGQRSSTVKRKLGMEGSSTPLWVIGGLVAAGGLLFLAAEIFDNKADAEPCIPGNC